MEISAALYDRILSYFEQRFIELQLNAGIEVKSQLNAEVSGILQELRLVPERPTEQLHLPPDFGDRLYQSWRSLATDEIGENFWSYPIRVIDLADEMEIPIEHFSQYLGLLNLPNLQVIKTRSNSEAEQILTFHPIAEQTKTTSKTKASDKLTTKKSVPSQPSNLPEETKFEVGDRVRVNQQRPQYALQTGTVTQVISVSCRVALDNGWSAFLPHHCLEKI